MNFDLMPYQVAIFGERATARAFVNKGRRVRSHMQDILRSRIERYATLFAGQRLFEYMSPPANTENVTMVCTLVNPNSLLQIKPVLHKLPVSIYVAFHGELFITDFA